MMIVGRKTVMRFSASSPSSAASVVKPHACTELGESEPCARFIFDDENALAHV